MGQAAFDEAVSGPYTQLKFDFDFRIIQGANNGADGIGFVYADSGLHGTSGALPTFSEEPNLAGSLGVGFDTWPNGAIDAEEEHTISLHWNGSHLANFLMAGSSIPSFENGNVHHATISVVPTGGGSDVSVSVTDGTNTIVGERCIRGVLTPVIA